MAKREKKNIFLLGQMYFPKKKKGDGTRGRPMKYDPEEFLEAAEAYFNWCLENPLWETQPMKRKVSMQEEQIDMVQSPKMRTMSIEALCVFTGISRQTFLDFRETPDFLEVYTRVRGIIETQQLEGATAGFLNPAIIARKLGLADKKEEDKKSTIKIELPESIKKDLEKDL